MLEKIMWFLGYINRKELDKAKKQFQEMLGDGNREEERFNDLKFHADKLSEEKAVISDNLEELKRKMAKFQGWKENPYLFIKELYPDIGIKSLEFEVDNHGLLIKKFDNVLMYLTKEEQNDHMREINYIVNSLAFDRELDFIVRDIQASKMSDAHESEKGKLLLQLLIFIAGMRKRFELLNMEFKKENEPQKGHNPTHPIGE